MDWLQHFKTLQIILKIFNYSITLEQVIIHSAWLNDNIWKNNRFTLLLIELFVHNNDFTMNWGKCSFWSNSYTDKIDRINHTKPSIQQISFFFSIYWFTSFNAFQIIQQQVHCDSEREGKTEESNTTSRKGSYKVFERMEIEESKKENTLFLICSFSIDHNCFHNVRKTGSSKKIKTLDNKSHETWIANWITGRDVFSLSNIATILRSICGSKSS